MTDRQEVEEEMYSGGRTTTCKNCWEKGHNVRSCRNQKVYRPPKEVKPRGRPKKGDARGKIASETMFNNTDLLPKCDGDQTVDQEPQNVGNQMDVEQVKRGDEVRDGQESRNADEGHVSDQESQNVGNEQLEHSDDMISEEFDVLSEPSSEDESSDAEILYEQPSQWSGVPKKRKKSERIIKMKLSKPIYDKDGGGSTIEKPLILD